MHIVALFEGTKGLLVLLVGFELLTFIHKDIHEAALRLVEHIACYDKSSQNAGFPFPGS